MAMHSNDETLNVKLQKTTLHSDDNATENSCHFPAYAVANMSFCVHGDVSWQRTSQ